VLLREDDLSPFGAIKINSKATSEMATPNLKVCLSSSKEKLFLFYTLCMIKAHLKRRKTIRN